MAGEAKDMDVSGISAKGIVMDRAASIRRGHRAVYAFVVGCLVLTGILLAFGNSFAPLLIIAMLGALVLGLIMAMAMDAKARKVLRAA